MLSEIPSENYTLIDFEIDSPALYRLMDVFVHVPVDSHSEAYGQIYVEALAAGIPSVFTLSGIANEFVEHGRNAFVVSYKNADAISEGITKILNDKYFRDTIICNGKADVNARYNEIVMGNRLENLFRTAVHSSQKK